MAQNTIEAQILIRALNKSDGAFKAATAQSARMAAAMESHSKRIHGAFGKTFGGLRTMFATVGGIALGKKAVEEFMGDSTTFARVERQLKNLGDSSGKVFEHVKKKAAEFQERFNLADDDVARGGAELLKWGRMNKKTFDQAVEVAAHWAKMTGQSHQEASVDIGRMVNDFEHASRQFREQGIDISKNKERWEAWSKTAQGRTKVTNEILTLLGGKLGNIGDVVAEQEGVWGKARIRMGDLLEKVGELITKYATPLKELVESPAKFEAAWSRLADNIDRIAKSAQPIVSLLNSANTFIDKMNNSPLGGGFGFANPNGPFLQTDPKGPFGGGPRMFGAPGAPAGGTGGAGPRINPNMFDAPRNPAGGTGGSPGSPQSRIEDAFGALGRQSSATGTPFSDRDLEAAARAIRTVESGSPGGNYSAVGVPVWSRTHQGGRARGAYQVMDANVGPWTEKWYGKRLTSAEFLANREAQDAVFKGQFGSSMQKHGFSGAAARWLGLGVSDPHGTTPGGYSSKASRLFEMHRSRLGNAPARDPAELARESKRESQRAYALGKGEVKVEVSVNGPGHVSGMKGRSGENLDVSAGIDNSGLSSAHRSAFPATAP